MQQQEIPQQQYQSIPVSSDELYANAVQEDKIKNTHFSIRSREPIKRN